MDEETQAHLTSLAAAVNEELSAVVELLEQALKEALEGAQAMETSERVVRKKLLELETKYKEDVEMLQMQMHEMGEAREVCSK